MYRLLLVDDEPIIVEGLHDLFRGSDELQLEIYCAFNAREALAIAGKMRIDVVLTDIAMPEMNGIELQKEMNRLWPRCKVVFLTGYNDFDYIRSSLRQGAIDYVLKTEEDETIVAAIAKTLDLIEREWQYEQMLDKARGSLVKAMPMLRKEYLSELLRGEAASELSRRASFAELGVPLDAAAPVLFVAGRVDSWRDDLIVGDKALFLFSVNNIVEDFFGPAFRLVYVPLTPDRLLWIMQPKPEAFPADGAQAEEIRRFLLGTMESAQGACRDYLKLPMSFVVGGSLISWEELPDKYDRVSVLFARGLGLGQQMLLTDEHMLDLQRSEDRGKVNRIHLLGQYLENKEHDKFNDLYADIMASVHGAPNMQTGIALEVFFSLAAIFVSYLNRSQLMSEMQGKIQINQLTSIQEHASWRDVTDYFQKLADLLFSRTADENEQVTDDVVRKLNAYIEANLHKDVSLTQLSEVAFLAPAYLSRLYKMKTGVSITDYITTLRIQIAKRLLTESQLQIREVGAAIGYDTPSYFSRFFRRETDMTPQEYRDAVKKS
ncbi:response regulator [Paenibacillus cymbidii]|uniref:response regulator n=1 Tax=Paenibacillus cymbidii TaxID=1639034 RepID=UPI001080D13A|nr:response regulator [Paenibacillus cymbidii]